MCSRCVDAAERLFPSATEEERAALLWEATPFPMGRPEDIVSALVSAHAKHGEDIGAIISDAYEELDRAMGFEPND